MSELANAGADASVPQQAALGLHSRVQSISLASSADKQGVADPQSSGKATKTRKPYTITKQRERWTDEEHAKFLEALKLHGRAWRKIEEYIGTKTAVQIRSHAQKFFTKVERKKEEAGGDQDGIINIPPPRPKRKPVRPYPRKEVGDTDDAGESHLQSGLHDVPSIRTALNAQTGSARQLDPEVTEATVAAVAAAASAAAAAAAAAVVAAAGSEVQAHLQVHPPQGFPFFGLPPTVLAQAAANAPHMQVNPGNPQLHQNYHQANSLASEHAAQILGSLAEATAATEDNEAPRSCESRDSDGDSACSRGTNNSTDEDSEDEHLACKSKRDNKQQLQQQRAVMQEHHASLGGQPHGKQQLDANAQLLGWPPHPYATARAGMPGALQADPAAAAAAAVAFERWQLLGMLSQAQQLTALNAQAKAGAHMNGSYVDVAGMSGTASEEDSSESDEAYKLRTLHGNDVARSSAHGNGSSGNDDAEWQGNGNCQCNGNGSSGDDAGGHGHSNGKDSSGNNRAGQYSCNRNGSSYGNGNGSSGNDTHNPSMKGSNTVNGSNGNGSSGHNGNGSSQYTQTGLPKSSSHAHHGHANGNSMPGAQRQATPSDEPLATGGKAQHATSHLHPGAAEMHANGMDVGIPHENGHHYKQHQHQQLSQHSVLPNGDLMHLPPQEQQQLSSSQAQASVLQAAGLANPAAPIQALLAALHAQASLSPYLVQQQQQYAQAQLKFQRAAGMAGPLAGPMALMPQTNRMSAVMLPTPAVPAAQQQPPFGLVIDSATAAAAAAASPLLPPAAAGLEQLAAAAAASMSAEFQPKQLLAIAPQEPAAVAAAAERAVHADDVMLQPNGSSPPILGPADLVRVPTGASHVLVSDAAAGSGAVAAAAAADSIPAEAAAEASRMPALSAHPAAGLHITHQHHQQDAGPLIGKRAFEDVDYYSPPAKKKLVQ